MVSLSTSLFCFTGVLSSLEDKWVWFCEGGKGGEGEGKKTRGTAAVEFKVLVTLGGVVTLVILIME